MARGRRCDSGCESWPDSNKYNKCPVCGEKTTMYTNLQPMTKEEAREREFELYYERWDEERDPSRLLPDAPNAAGRFRNVAGLIAASAHEAGSLPG